MISGIKVSTRTSSASSGSCAAQAVTGERGPGKGGSEICITKINYNLVETSFGCVLKMRDPPKNLTQLTNNQQVERLESFSCCVNDCGFVYIIYVFKHLPFVKKI